MTENQEPRNTAIVLTGIIASLMLFIGIFGLLYFYYRVSQREVRIKIEMAPSRELSKLRAEEAALLHDYAFVNREKGLVRIPIERAIELEARAPWRVADGFGPTAPAPQAEDGGTTHAAP